MRKGNKETKNVNFVQSLFVKMPKKKGRKISKIRKFEKSDKNFQKGSLQKEFYVVNYGKI